MKSKLDMLNLADQQSTSQHNDFDFTTLFPDIPSSQLQLFPQDEPLSSQLNESCVKPKALLSQVFSPK